MRKCSLLFLLIIMVLPLYGCIDTSPIIPDGKWCSEDPNMYIEFGAPIRPEITGLADQTENLGEIYYPDGSFGKIKFTYLHGDFHLYEYQLNGEDLFQELYAGEYKLHEDTLTLYVNDGTEIILTRQE